MVKVHRRRHTRRRQHGGGGYGYTAPAGMTAEVPFADRAPYEVCSDARVAPALPASAAKQFGGGQNGGGCGCATWPPMQQGGAGSATGGYGFTLDNTLGKVYASVNAAPCPQRGGGEATALSSYSAGYGFGNPFTTANQSAHFFEQQAYPAKTCMGGGARKSHKKAHKKAHRKSHKKSHRKSHKKAHSKKNQKKAHRKH